VAVFCTRPPPPPGGGDKLEKETNLPFTHTQLSLATFKGGV